MTIRFRHLRPNACTMVEQPKPMPPMYRSGVKRATSSYVEPPLIIDMLPYLAGQDLINRTFPYAEQCPYLLACPLFTGIHLAYLSHNIFCEL